MSPGYSGARLNRTGPTLLALAIINAVAHEGCAFVGEVVTALGPEAWTVVASVVGAVFGTGSALLVQRQAQRATDRTELRRSALALAEARRAERLTHIVGFLEAVQAAERIAVDRHHHGIDDAQLHDRANGMIDRIWVLQKTSPAMTCTVPSAHE